jgi:hypothetical protein
MFNTCTHFLLLQMSSKTWNMLSREIPTLAITRVHTMPYVCSVHCKHMPHIWKANGCCWDTTAKSVCCIFPTHINGIHQPVNSFIQRVFVSKPFFNMLRYSHSSFPSTWNLITILISSCLWVIYTLSHCIVQHCVSTCNHSNIKPTPKGSSFLQMIICWHHPTGNFLNASYTKTSVNIWTHTLH